MFEKLRNLFWFYFFSVHFDYEGASAVFGGNGEDVDSLLKSMDYSELSLEVIELASGFLGRTVSRDRWTLTVNLTSKCSNLA